VVVIAAVPIAAVSFVTFTSVTSLRVDTRGVVITGVRTVVAFMNVDTSIIGIGITLISVDTLTSITTQGIGTN